MSTATAEAMSPLPLIPQLQQDALDPTVKVSDLLRKAKFVAAKLNLPDLMEWADKELRGYEEEAPKYRIICGSAKAFNPYGGWVPIIFETTNDQNIYTKRSVGSSVSQIEDLLGRDSSGKLIMPWPANIEARIREAMEFTFDVTLFVDRSQLSGVLDAIRNAVLDWSLKLESAGIIGEGFTFTQKEKELAHQPSVNYQINSIQNFSGNLGPASENATINSNQTNNYNHEAIKNTIDQIEKIIPIAELNRDSEIKARELVSGIRQELSSPQPNSKNLKIMLDFLKKVAEGASSKIVADGIISNIDKIL